MKKLIVSLLLLAPMLTVISQEYAPTRLRPESTQSVEGFTLPDSLAHMSPWKPEYTTQNPFKTKPLVSMTSVIALPQNTLPKNLKVLNNNTLRFNVKVTISNGQAWNHGSFPDAFLDARTLSMPLPRK